MILAYLLLFTGLTISSVAIYYSVVGLTAIFSAAATPIMIMGVSLEVAKLVCATWIKQYWHQVPRLMKTYMVIAVTVLMFITSMGIFGFLSKAHNDQNLVSGDVGAKLAIFDEKIKTARDNIEAGRKQLQQMDAAVDQVMSRSTDEKGADKAVAIRNGQKRDRANIAKDIEANQKIISQLNDEAAPIRAENRKVEAEVGPIKYIAAFIYGVAPDSSMLEKAVTWIIIMIVIVFDPLAVIMLLAAQMTFGWIRGVKPVIEETPRTGFIDNIRNRFKKRDDGFVDLDATELDALNKALQDSYEPQEPVVTDELTPEEIDRINRLAAEYAEPAEPDYTDYSEGALVATQDPEPVHTPDPEPEEELPVVEPKKRFAGFAFPMSSIFGKPKAEPVVEEIEPPKEEVGPYSPIILNPNAPGLDAADERPGDYITREEPMVIKQPEQPAPIDPRLLEAAPGPNRGIDLASNSPATGIRKKYVPPSAQADNAPKLGKGSTSGFGNEFPASSDKGDVFVRTDYLPNRLFKFNGNKWIEVDKAQSDLYTYDELYIKHLVDQIAEGKYDADSLTDVEREQIAEYLKKNA